jgi:Zn-dependent protease
VRQVDATPAQLLPLHREAVASARKTPLPVRTDADAEAAVTWHHEVTRDFHLKRGVFCEPTAQEKARLDAALAAGPLAEEPSAGEPISQPLATPYADVVQQMNELQNAPASYRGAIAVLAISVLLFLLVGRQGWPKSDFLYLLPILFIHELGHFVTMKMFGYRNLKMFFIPFFGAAVTGRNYNVAGWKKAVVALMGPLPGIAAGIALGIAGVALGNPDMIHIAFLAIAINAFNLLPILPLDGGHVFQAVLFSRHYLLDVAFRILAVIAMLVVGLLLGGRLVYIAILLALGIPLVLRLGKITDELRRQPLPPATDGRTIHPELAEKIVEKVMASSQKRVATKIVAQQSLTVYENLNARAPGILASLGLLSLQGSAIVASVVAALVFVVAERGDLASLLRNARPQSHTVYARSIETRQDPRFEPADPAPRVVGATFAKTAQAAAAYRDVTNHLPPAADAILFGDSVLVTLPAADAADASTISALFELSTRAVFTNSGQDQVAATFTVIVPDATTGAVLASELSDYLPCCSATHPMVAPWHAGTLVTPDQYDHFRHARATYARLKTESQLQDDDYTAMSQKAFEAHNRGDKTAMTTLQQQIHELQQTRLREKAAHLAELPEAEIDHAFLAAITTGDNAALNKDPLPPAARTLLGQLPDAARHSAAVAQTLSSGHCTHDSLVVNLFVTTPHPEALVALAHWLETRHCTRMQYSLFDIPASPEDAGPEKN